MISNTTYYSLFKQKLREQFPISEWFSSEGTARVKNIAIGVVVGLGSFLALAALFYVLETRYSWFSCSQDAIKIFNVFKNTHPLLDSAWRGVWRGFVVLGGPILEELMFRGMLNNAIKRCQGEDQTVFKRVIRIALVAILFGACHLSPFQNTVTNIVIVSATTALGFVLMLLKEWRKDLVAPITAHIIFNLCSTL